jgi:hypothetical protein
MMNRRRSWRKQRLKGSEFEPDSELPARVRPVERKGEGDDSTGRQHSENPRQNLGPSRVQNLIHAPFNYPSGCRLLGQWNF